MEKDTFGTWQRKLLQRSQTPRHVLAYLWKNVSVPKVTWNKATPNKALLYLSAVYLAVDIPAVIATCNPHRQDEMKQSANRWSSCFMSAWAVAIVFAPFDISAVISNNYTHAWNEIQPWGRKGLSAFPLPGLMQWSLPWSVLFHVWSNSTNAPSETDLKCEWGLS